MPRKSATLLKEAIANYEDWIEGDPSNEQYRTRLAELKAELEEVRTLNRKKAAEYYKPSNHAKRIAWLVARLERLDRTREYYTIHHASNPEHFDYQFEQLSIKQTAYTKELEELREKAAKANEILAASVKRRQKQTLGELWEKADAEDERAAAGEWVAEEGDRG